MRITDTAVGDGADTIFMFHELLERLVTAAHLWRRRHECVAPPVVPIRASNGQHDGMHFLCRVFAITPTAEDSIFSRVVHTHAIHNTVSISRLILCVFVRRTVHTSYTRSMSRCGRRFTSIVKFTRCVRAVRCWYQYVLILRLLSALCRRCVSYRCFCSISSVHTVYHVPVGSVRSCHPTVSCQSSVSTGFINLLSSIDNIIIIC